MTPLPLPLPRMMSDGELVLAAPRLEDSEPHRLAEDEEMLRRFDSRRPATADETRAAFQQWVDRWESGAPNRTYLAWRGGELVGGVEIRRVSEARAELSWWTYAAHRRGGVATRAARLLCEAAIRHVDGLSELRAHIDPDNAASRALAARLGFVETGTVNDTAWDGAVSTRLVYTLPIAR